MFIGFFLSLKQAVWIYLLYWNDFTDWSKKNYERIWFLPTPGISSCGISGKIITVNWLLCFRFFWVFCFSYWPPAAHPLLRDRTPRYMPNYFAYIFLFDILSGIPKGLCVTLFDTFVNFAVDLSKNAPCSRQYWFKLLLLF